MGVDPTGNTTYSEQITATTVLGIIAKVTTGAGAMMMLYGYTYDDPEILEWGQLLFVLGGSLWAGSSLLAMGKLTAGAEVIACAIFGTGLMTAGTTIALFDLIDTIFNVLGNEFHNELHNNIDTQANMARLFSGVTPHMPTEGEIIYRGGTTPSDAGIFKYDTTYHPYEEGDVVVKYTIADGMFRYQKYAYSITSGLRHRGKEREFIFTGDITTTHTHHYQKYSILVTPKR